MATYEIETEDGSVYEIETEDQPIRNTDKLAQAAGAGLSMAKDLLLTPQARAGDAAGMGSPATLLREAMVPTNAIAQAGSAMREPSKWVDAKLSAEGHPVLGTLAGIATDPTTYMGAPAGAAGMKGATKAASRLVGAVKESADPRMAGKMATVFENPSVVLPSWMGGPKSMSAAKRGLDEAEAQVLKNLKKTSLEELDKSAKVLERSRSGLQKDVVKTVDDIRMNQVVAKSPNLSSKVKPTKVEVERLIQAEKALKQRIDKLWDSGLGDHAKAMQMELDRVSTLVDEAMPQLKGAREAWRLAKLREEVGGGLGKLMSIPFAGMSPLKVASNVMPLSYAQAGLGAMNRASRTAGGIAGAAGGATVSALDRLKRRYLPREAY